MNAKEVVIRNQRTNEAMQKKLMGFNGKLGCIARMFGDKVVSKYGSGRRGEEEDITVTYSRLESHEIEDGMPTIYEGEEQNASFYNGYSSGLHLEIMHDGPEIWATWKGNLVYQELGNELEAFCPGEWEAAVDRLAVAARKKEMSYVSIVNDYSEETGRRRRDQFLEEMKQKWGL